jgi:hypothetical protein
VEIPKLTPVVQFVTASFALVVGGYTAGDKFGWFQKPILEWAPEHFSIKAEQIGKPISVTVARIKKRDDCSVEAFVPTVRDSAGMMHDATPSTSKFTGPAGDQIDTFAYQLTLSEKEKVAPGKATLTAVIKYKCPEGERVVTYPRHENLSFFLEKK